MTKQSDCRISHVLYRVSDLHQAVEKLRDAGFIVEYGTEPEKAYNALIWFEQGCFVEIFKSSTLPFWVRWAILELVDDKKGLQQVHFKGSVLTIEDILDPRK
jgi:hypothetical protein